MNQKEKNIAGLIAKRIKKKDPRAEVILFGSHARGRANDESDWDILILIDEIKTSRNIENLYRDEIFQLEIELEEAISSLIYSKKDWQEKFQYTPLYNAIIRDGIRL